jgi:hypothetical protein
MANKAYAAIALIGGGVGYMDSIDGAGLSDGDMCSIQLGAIHYEYTLAGSSGATESSPFIIAPDTNPSTKRWLLSKIICKDLDVVNSTVATLLLAAVGDGTNCTVQKFQDTTTNYFWFKYMRDSAHGTEAYDFLLGYNNGSDTVWVRHDVSDSSIIFYKDLKFGDSGGKLQDNVTSPSGTRPLAYNGYWYATRSYAPVYADYAERYELADNATPEYGKCYKVELDGKVRLTNRMPDRGLVGIASDTYGMCLGGNEHRPGETPRYVEIAVGGRVLAVVDRIYEPGTLLTGGEGGVLTWMVPGTNGGSEPIAKYLYPEKQLVWGPEGEKVAVMGRHWVKVI